MHSCSKLFRKAVDENPNPYVVGLDVSLTSTGVYEMSLMWDKKSRQFNLGGDRAYSIKTTPKTGTDSDRINYLVDEICRGLADRNNRVIAVCIEDYGPINKFAGKVTQRAEIIGCVKRFIRNELQVPYYTVSPMGLKSYATGGTKGGKDAVIKKALYDGFEAKTSDEADAFYAACIMRDIVLGVNPKVSVTRINPKGFSFSA